MTWHGDEERYQMSGEAELLCHFTKVKEIGMSATLIGGITLLSVSDKKNIWENTE